MEYENLIFSDNAFSVVRCHNVKNGKESSEVTEGKSSSMRWARKNRVKEIRRKGKDGLKINQQQHCVRKKVSRAVCVR